MSKLASAGFTGKGQTIVIFAFDGFDQADLDSFATLYKLPRFTPTLVGGQPAEPRGETTMDLEVAHAIAPDAQKVVINARPTVEGDGGVYEKIAQMLESADQQFPGAVWSFSIGWGCDKLITAADLAPVRSALADAHANGTTAFNASGDLAGLECKGGQDWSSPPSDADIGLDSVASLPEMTDVGGTTLSTDAAGVWQSEQAWFDVPLSLGSGGGVSALFDRPPWQRAVLPNQDPGRRLTPDVSAVADQFTGVKIVFNGKQLVGGGTSQSAPIWAGLAAVMNQYLVANGGRRLGDFNPLLYTGRRGLPAARLPRRDPRRQRGRRRGARLRPGHRPRHPRRRQPRPQHPHPAEGDRVTHRPDEDAPATMECRVCQTDVPAGEFCGLCGDYLTEQRGNGPSWLRLRAYGADPGEHLLAAVVGQLAVPAAAAPVPTTVPVGACRRAARAGHVRDPADARGVDHGGVARPSAVVPDVHAGDRRLPRCAQAHTASHHGVGHRARRRLGAADRCGRRALVRRAAGHRDRGGPDSCERGSASRSASMILMLVPVGGGAPAAAADARVHGRLHDRRARCARLHRGGDH